jgi:hypothetical protein
LEPKFDVYVTGDTLDGFQRDSVVAGLVHLFSIDGAAAEQLFDGSKRQVKAGCDKATALRYREALAGIGAAVLVERHPDETPHSASLASQGADVIGETTTRELASGQSSFELAPTGALMSDPTERAVLPVVTVPDYALAEPGALIPSVSHHIDPIDPDISHLQLDPIEQ